MATWDWQAELFLRQSQMVFPIGPEDSLLDIGCGPGSLLHALILRDGGAVVEQTNGGIATGDQTTHVHIDPTSATPWLPRYLGLDVSEASIAMAKQRRNQWPLADAKRHDFVTLGSNYLDLSAAMPKGYSRLLALSVVQYYRDSTELRFLLDALYSLAAPGALILVADLPLRQKGGAWGETWSETFGETIRETIRTLKRAFSEGAFLRQMVFLMRCLSSAYRQTHKQQGLLTFTQSDLNILAMEYQKRWQADVQILTTPLTISLGRAHLRIALPAS